MPGQLFGGQIRRCLLNGIGQNQHDAKADRDETWPNDDQSTDQPQQNRGPSVEPRRLSQKNNCAARRDQRCNEGERDNRSHRRHGDRRIKTEQSCGLENAAQEVKFKSWPRVPNEFFAEEYMGQENDTQYASEEHNDKRMQVLCGEAHRDIAGGKRCTGQDHPEDTLQIGI